MQGRRIHAWSSRLGTATVDVDIAAARCAAHRIPCHIAAGFQGLLGEMIASCVGLALRCSMTGKVAAILAKISIDEESASRSLKRLKRTRLTHLIDESSVFVNGEIDL